MSAVDAPDQLYGLLARAGESRRMAAGGVVFERGDHGNSMYILTAGTIALKLGDDVVDSVQAPGLFGEMALIESKPRALSAVADGDVEVVEIPARQFWILVHETPRFAQLVMSVMADRLRRISGTL